MVSPVIYFYFGTKLIYVNVACFAWRTNGLWLFCHFYYSCIIVNFFTSIIIIIVVVVVVYRVYEFDND